MSTYTKYGWGWLLVFAGLLAQAQNVDSRLWLGLKVEKEVGKNTELGVSTQYRREANWSTFDQAFIEPFVEQALNDRWSAGAEYRFRFSRKARTGHIVREQRATAFVQYKMDVWSDFELGVKTALQYGMEEAHQELFDRRNELTNRTKAKMEYHLFGTPITFSLAEEMFYQLNQNPAPYVDKCRTTFGLAYECSNSSTIDVSYLFDFEMNRTVKDGHSQVLALKYSIKL
ncbi:DUF2490 domain-containing protein [Marinoscillum furvescens]|uniref:Uncharacterized protein DUF2490 n=1 Tax=Marinoscillum furvescens DSM 4134 TaxID=1122208 RepID=A0A3D9L576_MARFU|nr:DUF2490 domain-containing protein [Marinoscillum furvescens]RED98377.1 uncharacterized protein DUF2490 [Marinoscillum furvescens DSM 4134]